MRFIALRLRTCVTDAEDIERAALCSRQEVTAAGFILSRLQVRAFRKAMKTFAFACGQTTHLFEGHCGLKGLTRHTGNIF